MSNTVHGVPYQLEGNQMFIVQNDDHVDCFKSESIAKAKEVAIRMKDECGENFSIIEIKQVWTTQTLDEAMKGAK